MRSLALSLVVLSLPGLVCAQSFGSMFDKAPADVDAALRARVTHFYQSHVESKFRQADQDVHEDSKDIFFAADKPTYKACKIASIRYEENFTKAKVVMDCSIDYFFPGMGMVKDAPLPVPSSWKLDQGQWWWYVIPVKREEGVDSPFGKMKGGAEAGGSSGVIQLFEKGPTVETIREMVKSDKSEITLLSHMASTGEATITNRFPDAITLRLDPVDKQGLTVKLERDTLKPGETSKLSVEYKPTMKVKQPDVLIQIHVDKTNQIIPIQIIFAAPPADSPARTPGGTPAPKN